MSIKKNLAWNFLLSASHVLLPLISIPYISRILTPEGIGRVSFIDSFTYYFISIAEFGIVVYGMRAIARVNNEPDKKNQLVSELLALHVLSSALALVFYGIAVFLMWDKIRDTRLLLFSLSFLLVNFFACEWYFLGLERFRYITLRSLFSRLLGLASIFILVKAPEDYYIYYAIIALSAICNSIWNNYRLFKEVPVSFKQINWKKHIAFTKITWLISLVYGITLLLDNVLLGLVSTAAAVGYYAFSMKIVRVSSVLLTDSLLVFFPRIVSLIKEGDQTQVQRAVHRNLLLLFFLGIPMSTGIYLLAEPLVIAFLGPQFAPAVRDLQWLSVYPLLKMYNLFLSKQYLIAHDHEKLYLRSLVAGSLFFVIAALGLGYWYADKGVCIAVLMAELLILILNMIYCRQAVPYLSLFDAGNFFQACIGAICFVPVIYWLDRWLTDPLQVVIAGILSCTIIYFVVQVIVLRNTFSVIIREWIGNVFRNGKREKI